MSSIFYDKLFPDQFLKRLSQFPVGYIPLGTLEWHGPQNVLGADALESQELFKRTALSCGGIVFPPLWLGPDRIQTEDDGSTLIGMDTSIKTKPHRQLPGSCYWIKEDLFIALIEGILTQAKRAGFKCLVGHGHGPCNRVWRENAKRWEEHFDLTIISLNDFEEGQFPAMSDHAGKNETSILLATDPKLVNLNNLPQDRTIPIDGTSGEDPRDSSPLFGEGILETSSSNLVKKLLNLEEKGFKRG